MVFLEHLPDETLASLLARLARFNGYVDYCDLLDNLNPGGKTKSFIDGELSLPMFGEATGHAYGTANEVIRKMTSLYAQAQLGEFDFARVQAIKTGKLVLSIGDFTLLGKPVLRYCHSCVEEDIGRYGFSYWHRVHQLPVVLICQRHIEPLRRFSCLRPRLHQYFPLPSDSLVQGEATPYSLCDGQVAFQVEIAAMAEQLFTESALLFDPQKIRDVLLEQLRARRLLSAKGKLALLEFQEVFEQFLSQKQTACEPEIFDVAGDPKQVLRGLIDFRQPLPFLRLILVHWLFGNWDAYKARYEWHSAFEVPFVSIECLNLRGGIGRESGVPDDLAIRSGHRQVCMDYVVKCPCPSRLEFLKTHYRSFRWLLHRDRDWLDAQLPLPPRQSLQLELFEPTE